MWHLTIVGGLWFDVWVKTSVSDPFILPSSPDSISFHYQSLFYSGLDLISRKQEERSLRENLWSRAFRHVCAVIFVVHPLQSRAFFSFSVLIIFLSQGFSASFASPPFSSSSSEFLIFVMAHFLRWWQIKAENHCGNWMKATEGGIK